MSDTTWNVEDGSLYESFSTESGYSFGEECDLEHDQWLQNFLTTIDKIVLLGKNPPKSFPDHILKECLIWRKKFNTKFSESERGAIFLKFSNQTEVNWSSVESTLPSSKASNETFRWDPSRISFKFSRQGPSTGSTESKSSSGTDNSWITIGSRDGSQDESRAPIRSRSIILEPLEISANNLPTKLTGAQATREHCRQRPLHLPPIEKTIMKSKVSPRVSDTSTKKEFPSPPIFFSINDLFSNKSGSLEENSTCNSVSSRRQSTNPFQARSHYFGSKMSTAFPSNHVKAGKYQQADTSS